MPISIVKNLDCLEAMREMSDNAFDLAIVDPPYGIKMGDVIGADTIGTRREKNGKISFIPRQKRTNKKWDNSPPTSLYFTELLRVSKNQIIWGANHFISNISIDSSCWIVWDKDNGNNNQSDCELSWTSFRTATRRFKYLWTGMIQQEQNKNRVEKRIHPTQKPVALYKWLLTNYAKQGDTILDTHLGSGSSRIAAHDLGFDFTGYELDADYFAAQEKRFAEHCRQPKLFEPERQDATQEVLFS